MQLVVQLAQDMIVALSLARFTPWTMVGTSPPSIGAERITCARALLDDFHRQAAPWQLAHILLVQRDAGLTTDDEAPVLCPHVMLIPTVHRVVLE
jgi:hypothetical protein